MALAGLALGVAVPLSDASLELVGVLVAAQRRSGGDDVGESRLSSRLTSSAAATAAVSSSSSFLFFSWESIKKRSGEIKILGLGDSIYGT